MLLDFLERKDNLDTKGPLEFKTKYMYLLRILFLSPPYIALGNFQYSVHYFKGHCITAVCFSNL